MRQKRDWVGVSKVKDRPSGTSKYYGEMDQVAYDMALPKEEFEKNIRRMRLPDGIPSCGGEIIGGEPFDLKKAFAKRVITYAGNIDFNQALIALKVGRKVARKGWNDKGMFLLYIDPYHNDQYKVEEKHETIVGTLFPYIAIKTTDNKIVPWLPTQMDLLAEDWEVIE